jgi:hypothetical protein
VFHQIKALLLDAPIMAHPRDHGEYILDVDACDVSIGAVLSQIQNVEERVIAYGSKSLNKSQKNYCVTDRELLAVRYFTEYYRSYLLGRKFLVRTDHQALGWLFQMKEPKKCIARWIETLSEFTFEIEHRAGTKHGNADSMSRCPNPWQCDCKDLSALRCGPCRKCIRKTQLMCGTLPGNTTSKSTQQLLEVPCASLGVPLNRGSPQVRITKQDLRNSWPLKATPEVMQKKQMEDQTLQGVQEEQ